MISDYLNRTLPSTEELPCSDDIPVDDEDQNFLPNVLLFFIEEPFHPSLRTHSLSGNLDGCLALSITYEYRLVFKFISDERVLLLDIGTHEDVY